MKDAPALDTLCRRLTELLSEGTSGDRRPTDVTGRGKAVADLLRTYAQDSECWRAFAHFLPERYSRNLVHRCGSFELLLLCWGEGHASPIHDHAGQECWMAVLDGELEEVHFRATEGAGSEGAALREGRARRFGQGEVAYIHDDIALHLIRPAPGHTAVSLHLYAAPIDACRTFDASGAPQAIEVGYHSVRGVPCAGRSAAEIRADWAQGAPASAARR
jgi:cysteine dioxygenase